MEVEISGHRGSMTHDCGMECRSCFKLDEACVTVPGMGK